MQTAGTQALCYRDHVTSLFPDDQPLLRPGGVRLIAIVCFVLAGYLALNAILIVAGTLSLASGRYVIGEYATMGPPIFFIASGVLVVLGIGLVKGWRFARRLGIVVAALLLATSAIPISAAVTYFQWKGILIHGAKIILAIMAIRYLLQSEVVDYFNARSVRQSM